jgi:protease I
VPVDLTLEEVKVGDYDAPGGQMNPDTLRINDDALAIIKAFQESGKVVAAVCHAPWLLIEAGAVKDRELTSYTSIRTDVINAGGRWVDSQVVADQGIVTSRHPGDRRLRCQDRGRGRGRAAQAPLLMAPLMPSPSHPCR